MSDHTAIEWTDATWNPLRGCSEVSPGCANCYAAGVAARFAGEGQPYEGLAQFDANGKAHWTGRIKLVEKALSQPLRWQRPRRVFVNSMGDLFHEDVSFHYIAKVFAVMALAKQHTFQLLTKRPRRMADWFRWIAAKWPDLGLNSAADSDSNLVLQFLDDADAGRQVSSDDFAPPWPLPNVWLGVSAEDQSRAEERIPALLATPAAVRFVSAEPLLGPIDLKSQISNPKSQIDWVIVGGESGPHARSCHPQWVRDLRDQCFAAGAAFFFKQWGEWSECAKTDGGVYMLSSDRPVKVVSADGASFDYRSNWDGRDGAVAMERRGKRSAGRLLDGREWSEFPGTVRAASC